MNFKRRVPGYWLILLPLLVPGLLVAVWRGLFRNIAEQRNTYIETVIDFEEIRQLGREEGMILPDLLAQLRKNGVSSLAISEDTLSSLESESKITVMSSKEVRKLSIDGDLTLALPSGIETPGALWVHSENSSLLDRIELHLSWKIANEQLIRIHRNLLMVNKSSKGFRERVGLGFSTQYFDLVAAAELGLVIRVFNYPGLDVETAKRKIATLPPPASVSALLFAEEEMLGVRGDLQQIIELFRNRSYRIGWIEFNIQDGINEYLNLLSDSRPFVRVHSITRREVDLAYSPTRARARWVRAARERSMKMLYIRCFFQDDRRLIENLVHFNLNYFNNIAKDLNHAGLQVARTPVERMREPRHLLGRLSTAERIAMAVALALGLPLLLKLSFLPGLKEKWFFITAITFTLGFFAVPVKLYTAVSGMLGAIVFASIGPVAAINWLEKQKNGSTLKLVLPFTFITLVPSLVGGLLIVGLFSELEYLLKFDQFRGVKLSLLLPIAFTGLWALKKYGLNLIRLINRPVTMLSVFIAVVTAGGILLYVLRSGNYEFMRPSALEDSFRTFLETTLVARPRNKEFLIGYPAIMLLIFFYLNKAWAILPVLAIFVQMGQTSVINTFCHFHSPLWLGTLRIFNGLWTGLLLGLPALVVAAIILLLISAGNRRRNSAFLLGYLGCGNHGDEILWRSFARSYLKKIKNGRISILCCDTDHIEQSDSLVAVRRSNWFSVFRQLLQAETLVIPGGGVLQSRTSTRSLAYYLFFMSIARLSGLKIALLAQGLGPFNNLDKKHPRLFSWLVSELKKVDYISLRDKESAEIYCQLTGAERAETTCDLSFLDDTAPRARGPLSKSIRLYVVLRSSVEGATQIASDLIGLNDEIENIELVPIAFERNEDEQVWRDAGWPGDILIESSDSESLLPEADLVISMRLHGCILASAHAVPWLGIAYDPKVSSYANSCRWKFCYNTEKINRKLLEEKINLMAVKRANLSEKLARFARDNQRKATSDFEKFCQAVIFHNSGKPSFKRSRN